MQLASELTLLNLNKAVSKVAFKVMKQPYGRLYT